jgi:hypothetical protein
MKIRLKYRFFIRGLIFSFLLQFLVNIPVSAQYDENVLKAAYVEHLTRFIEWPHGQSAKDSTNFVIGVYGDEGFYNILKIVLKGKMIKSRNTEIIQVTSLKKIESCDLCYISGILEKEIEKIMYIANKNGVLIMTENKNFGVKGIHINFYLKDKKLKFEINKQSMDSGKFKVSSLLLKNSKIL